MHLSLSSPLLSSPILQYMVPSPWPCFCQWPLPVKMEVFLPTFATCMLMTDFLIGGLLLYSALRQLLLLTGTIQKYEERIRNWIGFILHSLLLFRVYVFAFINQSTTFCVHEHDFKDITYQIFNKLSSDLLCVYHHLLQARGGQDVTVNKYVVFFYALYRLGITHRPHNPQQFLTKGLPLISNILMISFRCLSKRACCSRSETLAENLLLKSIISLAVVLPISSSAVSFFICLLFVVCASLYGEWLGCFCVYEWSYC